MTAWKVSHLDEIPERDDGRCPYRPVRQHFGLTTFGASTWTGANVGDRLINEHSDESDELYLVLEGLARFEIEADSVRAPRGTFIHVALELAPKLKEFAREDADLAAVRDQPLFDQITGSGHRRPGRYRCFAADGGSGVLGLRGVGRRGRHKRTHE